MKSNWPQVRLGEVGKIITGKTPKTDNPDNYGGYISFLTPSDNLDTKHIDKTRKTITKKGLAEIKNCLIPPKSICVSCIGSNLGKVVMTTTALVTNQQINSIIPSENYDPDFIYYSMIELGKQLNYISKTSTAVPIINKSTFSNCVISVPPLPTQRAIAATLSCLDDKIALNHRINANLEAQAQAIFKSWFVDFDPFKGGKFVDSELGRIPKGWKMGLFSDLVNVKYGKAHQSLGDGIFPVYGSGGLMRYAEKYLYNKESVLIPRKGTLDNVMYVKEPFWTVDTMFYTEMKRPHISPFVYQFVKQKNLSSMNVGTAVPSMTTEILNALLTIVPPDGILCDYDKIASILYDQMRLNAKQSRTLAAIRDALLPKLMSGEIEVKL